MNVKNFKLWILFLCVMVVQSPANAQNNLVSDDPPYPCPYPDGSYYQAGAFARFDAPSQALLLVNANGETVTVLDSIDKNVRLINWSPDCRYLTGAVGLITDGSQETYEWVDNQHVVRWGHKDIVFWDTTTGGRVHTFENNPGRYLSSIVQPAVIWQPESAYAVVLGGCGIIFRECVYERIRKDYIWQRESNQAYRVGLLPQNQLYPGSRARFNQYYWDMSRGWLWGSGLGGVSAYDIRSGEEVRVYPTRLQPTGIETRFRFSPDESLVIVYSVSEPGYIEGGITVYDIDTATPTYVNAEGFGAPNIPLADYHPIALSADNRYLIAGYDAIRVWDLQNLPENNEDRLPIYRHGGPRASIWSITFSDWGVIETTSEEGVQHWDLHTGVFIPAS